MDFSSWRGFMNPFSRMSEEAGPDSGEQAGPAGAAGGQQQQPVRGRGTRVVTLPQDNVRICWVCFANDHENPYAVWVRPCRCRGSTQWVHQACIQRWVDEKQRGNLRLRVRCPQCKTEYIIAFPHRNLLTRTLAYMDDFAYRACPLAAAGIVLGSIYWSAISFGGMTLVQLLGRRTGMTLLETADPLLLLIGLPSIPVVLVLIKMVRWEEYVVKFLRRRVAASPRLGYILPSFRPCGLDIAQPTQPQQPRLIDPVSSARVLCSALFLPTAASLCGRILFESSSSTLQRTVLGGLVFISIKGLLRVYLSQQQHIRRAGRIVHDYPLNKPPERRVVLAQPEQVGEAGAAEAQAGEAAEEQANDTQDAARLDVNDGPNWMWPNGLHDGLGNGLHDELGNGLDEDYPWSLPLNGANGGLYVGDEPTGVDEGLDVGDGPTQPSPTGVDMGVGDEPTQPLQPNEPQTPEQPANGTANHGSSRSTEIA